MITAEVARKIKNTNNAGLHYWMRKIIEKSLIGESYLKVKCTGILSGDIAGLMKYGYRVRELRGADMVYLVVEW